MLLTAERITDGRPSLHPSVALRSVSVHAEAFYGWSKSWVEFFFPFPTVVAWQPSCRFLTSSSFHRATFDFVLSGGEAYEQPNERQERKELNSPSCYYRTIRRRTRVSSYNGINYTRLSFWVATPKRQNIIYTYEYIASVNFNLEKIDNGYRKVNQTVAFWIVYEYL